MADGTPLNVGNGGDIIDTDDLATRNGSPVSGIKVQRMKVGFGPDGDLRDVDTDHPLPVEVSDLPLPVGAATAALQNAAITLLNAIGATLGSPLQAGGSVSISGPVAVTGTFWQAIQPVSGTVTANAGTGTFNIAAASLPLPTGAATAAGLTTINATLGTPFQAGGSIGNTAFGISGTLPAFASTPTFNIGTIGGAASAANQVTTHTKLDTVIAALGSPLQAGGAVSITGTVPVSGPLTDAQLRANDLHVVPANITGKFREAFETLDTTPSTGKWTLSAGTGDIVQVDGNALAASYLVISKSPWDAGNQTTLETQAAFTMPIELAFGAHLSQRTLGQEFAFEIVDTGTPLPSVPDLAITSIAQTASVLTVSTDLPHGLKPGMNFGIRGVLDSRMNYPALVVASIPAPNQFTATAGPGGNIPSLSAYTASVLASTTAALPANVYANGTAGVGATLTASANGAFPAQDGVAIPLNGRVLVRFEAAPANNGVYFLSQVGSAGTPWILTRATDYDTTAELTVVAGALFAVSVFVAGGATQAQKEFYLSATVTTVGTTAVTWVDSNFTGPLGSVFFRERLGRANNGASQIFENPTATNASLYIRSESGDVLPSGVALGNHSVAINTTASVQLANAAYTYAFAPTTEYRINLQADRTQWYDSAVDAVAQTANRLLRTQVCPDPADTYKFRIRANNSKSLTVITAKVVSVSKPGTTVGTFETDRPHGLVTGDLIQYFGNSNTGAAAFPNVTTATPVTVIDADTFTVAAIGTAATVTGYGGFIAKVHGGNLLPGTTPNAAVSAALSTLSDGTRQLVLTGVAAWSGLLNGDYVELAGVGNVTNGALLGVDGAWEVANIVSTALVLVPATAAFAATLPANFGTTTCGGGVVKRTDLRVSFVRLFDYERERVELLARPAGDLSAAAPVALQGGSTAVTVSSGTVTTVSALTGGGAAEDAAAGANPVLTGGVVRTGRSPQTAVAADALRHTMTTEGSMTVQPGPVVPLIEVASGARTSTGNSGLISTATGGGLSGLISVTAFSGTAPTLDLVLAESYDNGATFTPIWFAPRITGNTNILVPPMLTAGLRRWEWTIAGTAAPSFTFAITANAVPSPCPIVRQIYDRTAGVLNGTNGTATADMPFTGCKAASAKVTLGAATTPATYQWQVSDDRANWSNVGTATAAVVSATTTIALPAGVIGNWARLIVTAAATGQTGTVVALQATS